MTDMKQKELEELKFLAKREFHMHMIQESPRVVCLVKQSEDSMKSRSIEIRNDHGRNRFSIEKEQFTADNVFSDRHRSQLFDLSITEGLRNRLLPYLDVAFRHPLLKTLENNFLNSTKDTEKSIHTDATRKLSIFLLELSEPEVIENLLLTEFKEWEI